MVLADRFQSLQAEMESRLFERREEIEGLILALLSRQHILLVGPKGAAKSMMIRMLANSIQGARYFERLLTRFTLPDELFGPVSISALKQDRFSRITRGYLPEAHFAFLDELWKANSSILNSLLAIINERLFYNDGEVIQCPLETMMSASAVEDDRGVLANVLGDDPASEPMVRGLVLDVSNPHDKRAREIMDALQVALTNLQGLDDPRDRTMAAVEFLSKLRTAKAELQGFRERLRRREADESQLVFFLGETDRYEVLVKREYLETG